jgi:cytochrome c oxidase assembly protein subunit 15
LGCGNDWPLCNGALFPINQGQLPVIHMLHRVAVLGLGVALGLVVWMAYRQRPTGSVRLLSVLALALFLVQAGIGALYVFSAAAPLWGAAHVGFAAATWALLVGLSVIETLNTRAIDVQEDRWQPQSEPLLN